MYKRRIVIHEKGCSLDTIKHELVHAYTSEMCISSCDDITQDDYEEFFAELFAKYGEDMLLCSKKIASDLILSGIKIY